MNPRANLCGLEARLSSFGSSHGSGDGVGVRVRRFVLTGS